MLVEGEPVLTERLCGRSFGVLALFLPIIRCRTLSLNIHPLRQPHNKITPRPSRNGHHSLDLVQVVVSLFQLNLPCGTSFAEESLHCLGSPNWIQSFLRSCAWAFDLNNTTFFLGNFDQAIGTACETWRPGSTTNPDSLMEASECPFDRKYSKYCCLALFSWFVPHCVASVENSLEYNKDFTRLPTGMVGLRFATLPKWFSICADGATNCL